MNKINIELESLWPSHRPKLDFDEHGWLHPLAEQALTDLLQQELHVVVEVGSWLGLSTRFLLNQYPTVRLYAIDTWEGSAEHHDLKTGVFDKLPTLYEQFLRNCWDHKDRLFPIRTKSTIGLGELYRNGIHPDMIFLDASHEYFDILADLNTIYDLFPGTLVIGDDWDWGESLSVQNAVKQFCEIREIPITNNGRTYKFSIPLRQNVNNLLRKHFHLRPTEQGCEAWDIQQVIEDSKTLITEVIATSSIVEFKSKAWFAFEGHEPTCENITDHAVRIFNSNTSYPIILDQDGKLIDGMHRVCKANILGESKILVKQFKTEYPPHHRVEHPINLPW